MRQAPDGTAAALAAAAFAVGLALLRPPSLVPVLAPGFGGTASPLRAGTALAGAAPAPGRSAAPSPAPAEPGLRDAVVDVAPPRPPAGPARGDRLRRALPPLPSMSDGGHARAASGRAADGRPSPDARTSPRARAGERRVDGPSGGRAAARAGLGRSLARSPAPRRAGRTDARKASAGERRGPPLPARTRLTPFARAARAESGGPARPRPRARAVRPAPRPRADAVATAAQERVPRARRGRRRRRNAPKKARFKPLLLSKLLGRRALRPPPADLAAPGGLLALAGRRPEGSASLADLESFDPAKLRADRKEGEHWDGPDWHDGAARGVERASGWLSLYRDGRRWWALAGEPAGPLVREDGRWWVRSNGTWFVVHDGEAWAWRRFAEWDAEGLYHPGSGTRLIYSKDFSRVAVVAPGQDAVVFDAGTGAELGRVPADRLPRPPRPKAPERLKAPW